MKQKSDPYLFQDAAVLQYANNKKAYETDGETYYNNIWPCFCEQKKLPNGLEFNP